MLLKAFRIWNFPLFPEAQRLRDAEAEERRLLEIEKEKEEAEERAQKISEMMRYQIERGAEESFQRHD